MRKKSQDEKLDLVQGLVVGIWIVLSVAVGAYAGYNNWQAVSEREASYRSLGWKTTSSKIVLLGNVNGGFKPVSQTATLEYRYDGELPLQTQQQIGLGYHNGDEVGVYVNNQGKVLVVNSLDARGRVIDNPTTKDFYGDYAGSFGMVVFVGIITAIVLVIAAIVICLIFVGIAIGFSKAFGKKDKQPALTS